MPKQSGLGDQLFLDDYDLTGDTGAVGSIGSPFTVLPVTGIDKSAPERRAALMDGGIAFQAWHNPTNAHVKLSALPRTNVQGSYFHGSAIGNPCASLQALQIGYNPTRGQDGSLTLAVQLTGAAASPLEWGLQGTVGKRSDVAATNGASLDSGVTSTLFGLAAYVHVFSFTGTSVTIKVQDSADNASFADLAGAGFVAFTAVGSQRVETGLSATVRRYLRVVTTGTFSQATFAVNLVRHQGAVTA